MAAVLGGAVAAGLGLGLLAVLVMAMWISSPYPDSGPGGALHTAAALWLLAHGTELIRTDTLSGVPAPMGLTPLLLLALPVWLLRRAARDAAERPLRDAAGRVPRNADGAGRQQGLAVGAWAGVVVGYLLVGAAAAAYASGGALRPSWASCAAHLVVVATAAAGAGVRTARGRIPARLPGGLGRCVAVLPQAFVREVRPVAVRAAAFGVLALLAGGALVAAGGLGLHGDAVRESFLRLTDSWSGRCTVLLLCLALVPNVVIWGATYALGPGFVLGAGHTVGPLTGGAGTLLPAFPLLGAVPSGGGGPAPVPLLVAAAAVPVGVAVTVAWRVAGPGAAWSPARVAGAMCVSAAVCGVATGGLATAAGGALGVRDLAAFGPVGWQAGAAAATWVVGVGVPVALVVRWWRGRAWRLGPRLTAWARSVVSAVPGRRGGAEPKAAAGEAGPGATAGVTAGPAVDAGPAPAPAAVAPSDLEGDAGDVTGVEPGCGVAGFEPYDFFDEASRASRWAALKNASAEPGGDWGVRDRG